MQLVLVMAAFMDALMNKQIPQKVPSLLLR
jgi:hypothetical protein